MSFIADKQTLNDLNMLGKHKPGSVYSLFNRVQTGGGERLLEHMFQHPLTGVDEINQRSRVFQYFHEKQLQFPLKNTAFRMMENYLGMGTYGSYLITLAECCRKKYLGFVVHDEQYRIITEGLRTTISLLHALRNFVEQVKEEDDHPGLEKIFTVKKILTGRQLEWLSRAREESALPLLKVARYDHLLRHVLRNEMESVMEGIYHLDAYIAVSDVARTKGFTYAHALPGGNTVISTTALSHPCLEKAVANPVALHREKNVFFLTGANMAGKSTFMKSFGIAVYLAHMGFPVAAADMKFSVMDGLYSSINVPDNLSLGYSHFYAEVLRVKEVAKEVSRSRTLVVIFDELFKGTNVKDAYDATLAVTAAFSEYRNCFFIISTHIIEVGEALRQQCDNLQYAYLPTVIEGTVPRYTYRLKEGITNDRHGMMIIENEKISEIIRS